MSLDSSLTEEAPLPRLGKVGAMRWIWRQLTSMRTALVLLFLLAIASVPGSLLPQRGTNPIKVKDWIAANPTTGPWLDKAGFFDVYSSPWFAAVYLLLFISLIGCVLPRVRVYWRALRALPPVAPRNLSRMPEYRTIPVAIESSTAVDALDAAEKALRGKRWRVRRGETDGVAWLSAETGYSREAGNLVFHLALIVTLIAIAIGGLFGWKGNVIVTQGTGFSNTLTQYDAWGGGRFVNPNDLAPFSFTLDKFSVEFERSSTQKGAPRYFNADVTYRTTPTAAPAQATIQVNEPLTIGSTKVFLVGHGYAPHFIVRDSTGKVVFDDSVVFLPQDGNFTSSGVVKVPDASPSLGFNGLFLPTAALDAVLGPHPTFPAPDYPAVFLGGFKGDLGLDSGQPQSVYKLDVANMELIGRESLLPGEMWTLPDGSGSIEFVDFTRWASFQIASDPGKELALVSTIIAIAGLTLSLFVRRRRLWVKADGTLVEIAALAKADAARLPEDVAMVVAAVEEGNDA